MKTKIIYISGSELFNISDVRTAFDTVRSALGLDNDTILFGVPVDKSDAFGGQFANISSQQKQPMTQQANIIEEHEQEFDDLSMETASIDSENIRDDNNNQKIIPICSVLTAEEKIISPDVKSVLDDNTDSDILDEEIENTPEEVTCINFETNILPVEQKTENIEDDISDFVENNLEIDSDTDDIIIDEEPTLEKLLESVKSLNEDSFIDSDIESNEKKSDFGINDNISNNADEIDMTLEQLANEFMENQDKIVNTTRGPGRGKIGKLKNILPFKKTKHEESSLIGDLFGWAGVAANDDEFSMPDFFPTTASKK